MTLELIPNSDLIFKGPFNVVSTTTLKLANSGNERLAYKIKTTAPKRYCVKPNSGFLDPQATANIQVMLQPQAAGQPDDRTKHKFMVQWVAVPTNYTEDVDNFWKQDLKTLNVQDSKLKCTFADEQPAAVVPNDSHGNRELNAVSFKQLEMI
jgi:vesicle-associated membrane protein-associated protein A